MVIALSRNGRPGEVGSLELVGALVPPGPGAFGPNGIRELPGGDLLLVSQGVLHTVDPDADVYITRLDAR